MIAESEEKRLNLGRRIYVDSVIRELECAIRDGETDSYTREDLSRFQAEQCDLIREANERGW